MEAPLPISAPVNLPSEPPSSEFERQVLDTLTQLRAAVEAAVSR